MEQILKITVKYILFLPTFKNGLGTKSVKIMYVLYHSITRVPAFVCILAFSHVTDILAMSGDGCGSLTRLDKGR